MPAANTVRMALPFEETLLPYVLRVHDAVYQKTKGWIGHRILGVPNLLLHTVGAKTGKARTTTLTYARDGDAYLVVASKGGDPKAPGWYHNLKANPNLKIEVGPDTIDVVASEATGEERERLYRAQAERAPQFADYAEKTTRAIPVIVLTPSTR